MTERHFNPRSREGSDQGLVEAFFRHRISIHAPVKGATGQAVGADSVVEISIHAPVKGATYDYGVVPFDGGFQSTLP